MREDPELARLLTEVESRPLGGWAFGWLGERMLSTPLPWSFETIGEQRGRLPFPMSSFGLVVSRHESFVPAEVHRVLEPGGRFPTQQLGSSRYDHLHLALGLEPPSGERPAWTLAFAAAQLEATGLRVVDSDEAETVTRFTDVGAVAWFLKAAPWVVPEFSLTRHRAALAALHLRIADERPYELRELAFWLEAVRDPENRADA